MSEANLSTEQPPSSEATRLSSSDVDPGGSRHHQGSSPQGTSPALRVVWRIERRDTFEALRRGRRRRQGPLTISWVPGDPDDPPRVGYVIGRRVGPAVVRNRLRRRLRALMRQAAPRLAPGAYLLGAAPEAAGLTFSQLSDLVDRLIDVSGTP
jgi:ribonuclease P protein component